MNAANVRKFGKKCEKYYKFLFLVPSLKRCPAKLEKSPFFYETSLPKHVQTLHFDVIKTKSFLRTGVQKNLRLPFKYIIHSATSASNTGRTYTKVTVLAKTFFKTDILDSQ